MSREAKVGIFVLLGLVVLTYFTFRVSKTGIIGERGYELVVDFGSASGLEPKANVKMAGVPIGKVEDIRLEDGKARIVLRIDEGVRVPSDSLATIETQGLLGEKYVEIRPGKETGTPLPPGGRLANTLEPTNMDELLRKVTAIADDVKKFTESLSGALGGEEGKQALAETLRNVREMTRVLRDVTVANEERMNRILANVDGLSADLKEISSANKENLRQTIENLKAFSETLKNETPQLAKRLEEMGTQVSGAIAENRENLKVSMENLRSASAKLDNTLDSANRVLAKIDRGEGTLGKLVTDNTAHDSLTNALDGIARFVQKSERIRTTLDYRLEYLTAPSEYKHYVNLKIQPSYDRYYQLGIVDDPFGKRKTTTTTTTVDGGTPTTTVTESVEDKLKFTALVAKRFSDLTVKGGIIESTGGLGLEYGFLKGRLSLGLDAYDFGREEDAPHLKVYANYDIVKSLYLTAGIDDPLTDVGDFRTFFFGFGIKFKDDDLPTLLGTVPLRP